MKVDISPNSNTVQCIISMPNLRRDLAVAPLDLITQTGDDVTHSNFKKALNHEISNDAFTNLGQVTCFCLDASLSVECVLVLREVECVFCLYLIVQTGYSFWSQIKL